MGDLSVIERTVLAAWTAASSECSSSLPSGSIVITQHWRYSSD
jgi:hypothetical protein